jgi:hypothetical protein
MLWPIRLEWLMMLQKLSGPSMPFQDQRRRSLSSANLPTQGEILREDSRVKSTTSTSHILLYNLCNNTDVLDNILTVDLSTLDSLQDGFSARLERKSRISITGNLILLSQFRLGLDK